MLAPQLLLQVSSASTCFRSELALDVLVDMPHTDFLCTLVRSNVSRVMSKVNGSFSAYLGNVVSGSSRSVREHRLGNESSVEMGMMCFCPLLLSVIWVHFFESIPQLAPLLYHN